MRFFLGPPPKPYEPKYAEDLENWLLRLVNELKRIEANLDVQWLPTKSTDDIKEGSTNFYFTDERAQDSLGNILVDTTSIDLTYDDTTPSISGVVLPAGVDHALLANLNSANYTHLTAINHTDLTDGGETILHTHAGVSTSNVTGPLLSVDGDVAVFDGITGKIIRDSGINETNLFLLSGRSGGQVAYGGTGSGENLSLRSTSNATKGNILFGSSSAFDEVNIRFGIGTTGPEERLHLRTSAAAATARIDTYSDTLAGPSTFSGYKARGTYATPTAVIADTELARFSGSGWYVTGGPGWLEHKAQVSFWSEEEFTSVAGGTYAKIETTPIGSVTRREVARFAAGGYLEMGACVAPSVMAADKVALYSKDAFGIATRSWWHAMGEDDQEHVLVGAILKSDNATNPSNRHESSMVINTFDDPATVKIFMDTAWREFLTVENADFRNYQAIAMVCHKGTTFPATPSAGQWFYRTDIMTLFFRQSTWKPIISFTEVTLYVDPAGDDLPDNGYASGTSACKTIQYAIHRIPAINGGNVVVNIAAGTYSEDVIIQGKSTSGNFSITLNGTLVQEDTGTCSIDGVKGIDGAQGTLTDTGNLSTAHSGRILREASDGANGYRIIDSCTADTATIVGTFYTKPLSGETYYVYSWGTTIEPPAPTQNSLTVRNQIMPVKINNMNITKIYATNNADLALVQCFSEYVNAVNQSVITMDTCLVSTVANSMSTYIYAHSTLSAYKTKLFNGYANGWVACASTLSKIVLANGTIVDGSSVADFGFIADTNSIGLLYSTGSEGFNRVQNNEWGVYSVSGSQIHGADVANCVYTNNTTADTLDDAATYAYVG